jgi:small subunit ribosomal protein S6
MRASDLNSLKPFGLSLSKPFTFVQCKQGSGERVWDRLVRASFQRKPHLLFAPLSAMSAPSGAEGSALQPGLALNEDDSRRGVRMVRRQRSANMKDACMPLYEHVFLARQDLAQAQVDALAETATKIIEDNGGKVVKTETWGLRSLAYRIQKNRKAHYVMLEIDAPASLVAELERQTQINEDVVRYMTIKVDAHEQGPSAMMRRSDRDRDGRGDRGERGGRGGDRDRAPRGERGPREHAEA